MMEITSMDHQVMDTHTLQDESLVCPKSMQQVSENKKLKPEPEQAPKCPRCDSTNTKFCYYNNYSLSQPRYFCKGCKRYWTKGGSLRNVPVGGGSRKNNKRSSLPSNSSTLLSKKLQDQDHTLLNNNPNPFAHLPSLQLPPLSFDPSDLSLAFASIHNQNTTIDRNNTDNNSTFMLGNHTNSHNNNATMGFLDILRSGTFVDHNATSHGSYDQSMCYGNYSRNVEEDGSMMFNFGGGLLINSTTNEGVITTNTTTTTNANAKEMMANVDVKIEEESKVSYQWPNISDLGNLGGVDSATRDYWSNGVNGTSSWHGLINSSLM